MEYILNIDQQTTGFRFDNRMFRKYSMLRGIEYEQLVESISQGDIFKAKNVPDILRLARESYVKKHEGATKEFTVEDADDWVDALGGLNSPKLFDVYKVFVGALLSVPPEKLEVIWKEALEKPEQKASEGKKKLSAA